MRNKFNTLRAVLHISKTTFFSIHFNRRIRIKRTSIEITVTASFLVNSHSHNIEVKCDSEMCQRTNEPKKHRINETTNQRTKLYQRYMSTYQYLIISNFKRNSMKVQKNCIDKFLIVSQLKCRLDTAYKHLKSFKLYFEIFNSKIVACIVYL